LLPNSCERMSVNTYPTWSGVDDDSMRTRSFQFLALGTLAAEAVAKYRNSSGIELFVREASDLPVIMPNPYRHQTKGEMAKPHATWSPFRSLAAATVSCGKWKRRNQQCGRCVPCLIRRASLHAAQIVDDTDYQYSDLMSVMGDEEGRDDLVAVQSAILREPLRERRPPTHGPRRQGRLCCRRAAWHGRAALLSL
jgi:hypothetical protein